MLALPIDKMLYIYLLCPHSEHITNMLALPIDKMLYMYLLLCTHSEHRKDRFQVHTLNTAKIGSNLNSLNTFTKETSSNKVKLPKVGSNATIVHAPTGQGLTKKWGQCFIKKQNAHTSQSSVFWKCPWRAGSVHFLKHTPTTPSNSGGGKNTNVGGVIQFTLTNKIEVSLYKNYMVLALSPL